MAGNQVRALKRILSERRALVDKEQRLLDRFLDKLPAATRETSRPRRALTCPRCDRRFALPVHVGRHMAMPQHRRHAR